MNESYQLLYESRFETAVDQTKPDSFQLNSKNNLSSQTLGYLTRNTDGEKCYQPMVTLLIGI